MRPPLALAALALALAAPASAAPPPPDRPPASELRERLRLLGPPLPFSPRLRERLRPPRVLPFPPPRDRLPNGGRACLVIERCSAMPCIVPAQPLRLRPLCRPRGRPRPLPPRFGGARELPAHG